MHEPLHLQEIDVHDVEYLRHGDAALLARLYLPRGETPAALLAELHGGAWCRGDRLDEDALNRELARRGVAVAAFDFRQPPQAGYPASLQDIHCAIRWLKTQAASLRARPDRVGVMGLSSGAHQAMLLAMRPHEPLYTTVPLPGGEAVDAQVAFAVLCWPVIDPLGRYHYAQALRASGKPYPQGIDRVLPDHDRYWPDEQAMGDASPLRLLERGEPVTLPPVLYLQGTADLMHPMEHLERFAGAYRRAGGELTLSLYPGEDAGFVNKRPDSAATAQAVAEIVQFVRRQAAGPAG
jgi:acetyl esterase/lipase